MSSSTVAAEGRDVKISSLSFFKIIRQTDDVAAAILDVLNHVTSCVYSLSIVLVTLAKSAKDVKSGYQNKYYTYTRQPFIYVVLLRLVIVTELTKYKCNTALNK